MNSSTASETIDRAIEMKESVLAKLRAGRRLNVHDCSFCGYKCGFFCADSELMYDNGCDCSYAQPSPRDEIDLDFFLDPKHGHVAKIEAWLAQP